MEQPRRYNVSYTAPATIVLSTIFLVPPRPEIHGVRNKSAKRMNIHAADSGRKVNSVPWWYMRVQIVQFGAAVFSRQPYMGAAC